MNSTQLKIKDVIDPYMAKTSGLEKFCDRCLRTERWSGNVVLMIVDAAFDSIGLNYFTAIVPKVIKFEEKFVENGRVKNLKDLSDLSHQRVRSMWGNERSWKVAQSVASYLHDLGERENLSDKKAFRFWASNSSLENWKENPIGEIKGVGLTTYQYLRMMGGIDTAMPDKIVRRVIEEILDKADVNMPTKGDLELIRTIDRMAEISRYRPIEICWMAWLVQSEGGRIRMEKYRDVLGRI
ncbi:hypothetical protein AKJ45_02125 [candidate division MSBL1 archaeon SCGC-AAA261F19]|uniref:HhH-GPD domain-containing protein n=2 Tax=candidate division MSBL1 TaxID=215777 RepID=A0A133V9X2_9EURY|nr:hypothetical protein AKJ43_02215 [candidate division MSBL1 archaeon SCGC-AAA261D19]KXB03242.1 hypothetical protein AKJ45_02125 [candidate division MSBL1 archaeon SCGC-AAA261F19]